MTSYRYIQGLEAGAYCGAAKMNPEFLQKLLSEDPKAKVVCQVSKTFSLDYVSLQTSTMDEVFSKFPEVLLVIRCHNADQRALYTLLADGPRVGAPYEMTRMVHVAVPADETSMGLARMFHIFKELNPHWTSIQVFLVDPDFTDVNAIHEAFPSAEVVLSASHVYTYIQQRIRELVLPHKAENILLNALKNTMCSATDRNLKGMYKILQKFATPSTFTQIKADWLLIDRIWALHRWRSWKDCLQYVEMMEALSHGLSAVFKISPCLIKTMNSFVLFWMQAAEKSKPEARDCSPEELAILKCKSEICEGSFEEPKMEAEAVASMSESLNNICNPAAFRLSEHELEVAEKSIELVGASEDQVCVQILEKPNEISGDICKTCTCSFYQCTKLPCRHILAVLNASKKTLQSDMLHTAWQRQADDGPTPMLPVTPETLEIMEAQGRKVSEKHLLAKTMTSQITTLLAECSDEVFQHRYNTLRELADTWIGPYEEVKL
ncbi:zinc finger SWIM domain-containing protein 1 isoform X1 [Ranitomeya variabilis]|uniref:zinc finger SWIM domain-containing protein 1 isoform X1 n=2 Tax=Ranitomeya variabilis TaxID=490064 RepID=UPI0040565700